MQATVLHLTGPRGLRPTQAAGSLRAGALALLAHGLLIAALSLGLNWRIRQPDTVVSAEIWAAVPQVAAPASVEPPPSRVEPPPPAPPPKAEPVQRQAEPVPNPRDAQIAIEKALRDKKAVQEHEADLRRQQKAQEALRIEAQRQAELKKAEQLKAEKAQADKDKERERAERLKKEQAQRDAQAADDRLAKQREANLARIRGQAGAEGAPTATGTAQRDAAPSSSYSGRIRARVKANIVLTADVPGNPVTEVEVRCSPDGLITGRRVVKTSGDKAWDETVLRAIDRTEMLPRDVDGRVPATMVLILSRRD